MHRKIPHIVASVIMLQGALAGAAQFDSGFSTNEYAERLQRALPGLAIDHLFEARRHAGGWEYSFFVAYDKTWKEEVRISVLPRGTRSSVSVTYMRVQGGMLIDSEEEIEQLSDQWSERIRAIDLSRPQY